MILPDLLDPIRKEQVSRLKETYKDFMESEEYVKITDYFFSQIYDTQYKDKRDAAFNQLYEKMVSVVGKKRIKRVSELKELNELTDDLDIGLTEIHMERYPNQEVRRESFEHCYFLQNRLDDRKRQIQLLVETTGFFHKLAHIPFLSFVIKPTRLAAKAMGIEHLMHFFMQGYDAFKTVDDASEFLNAVRKRELEYLEYLQKRYGKK